MREGQWRRRRRYARWDGLSRFRCRKACGLTVGGRVSTWRPWRDQDAPEIVDAILLSVSELVTNAHVHAHSDAQLVLTWDSHCLHVSVHDSDPLPPARKPEDLTTTGGADWLSSTHSPTAGPRILRRRARPSPRASYHRALRSLGMAGTSAEFRGGSDP